jgi:hypothetical protein
VAFAGQKGGELGVPNASKEGWYWICWIALVVRASQNSIEEECRCLAILSS